VDDIDELAEYESSDILKTKNIEEIVGKISKIKELLLLKKEWFLVDNENKIEIKIFKIKNKIHCQIEDIKQRDYLSLLLVKLEELLNIKENLLFDKIDKEITNKDSYLFDKLYFFLSNFKEIKMRSE